MKIYQKVIFSHVDGVLNSVNRKSLQSVVDLDKHNTKALKWIVEHEPDLTILWFEKAFMNDDGLTISPIDALDLLEWSKKCTVIKVQNATTSFQTFVEDFLRQNIVVSYAIIGPDIAKFDADHYVCVDPKFGLMHDDAHNVASKFYSRIDGDALEKLILDKDTGTVLVNGKYMCTFVEDSTTSFKFIEDPNCASHKSLDLNVIVNDPNDTSKHIPGKLTLHRHDDLCKQSQKCASLFVNEESKPTLINVVACCAMF